MGLKSFTVIFSNTTDFKLVTSWLDTVLSPFLHIVDDGFYDFLTNGCYHFADSFFQVSDSFWIILIYCFLQVSPEIRVEVWKIWWPNCPLNIPNRKVSFTWNRWRRSDMLSSTPLVHVSSRPLRLLSWVVSWLTASLEKFSSFRFLTRPYF